MKIIYRVTFLLVALDSLGRELWVDFFVNHQVLVWGFLIVMSSLLSFCLIQSMMFRFSSNMNLREREFYVEFFLILFCLSVFTPAFVAHGQSKVASAMSEQPAFDFSYQEALRKADSSEEKERIASYVYWRTGVAISYMSEPDRLSVYVPTRQDIAARKASIQEVADREALKNMMLSIAQDNLLLLLVKLVIFLFVAVAVTLYHRRKLTSV